MKAGELVKSKLDIHVNGLTTWRILEVNIGLSGRKIYFCEAAHDTKSSYGFDKIKRDFKKSSLHSAEINGLITSYLLKKSSRRPKLDT